MGMCRWGTRESGTTRGGAEGPGKGTEGGGGGGELAHLRRHLGTWEGGSSAGAAVVTPPMVGPTWPRVRSVLGSDCLPALS